MSGDNLRWFMAHRHESVVTLLGFRVRVWRRDGTIAVGHGTTFDAACEAARTDRGDDAAQMAMDLATVLP